MKTNLPPVIAHRGASGYAPENTAAAFLKAKNLGILWVEADVALTRDEVAVIFHDETLSRTTNGTGNIYDISVDELLKLDSGLWFGPSFVGERVLTLSAFLTLLKILFLGVNLELKPYHGNEKKLVQTTLDEIHEHWPRKGSLPLLSSFSLNALKEARKLNDEISLGLNVETFSDTLFKEIKPLHLHSIHLPENLVTPERIQQIKSNGYQVISFTIDDPARATQLFEWGLDGVFSNYPDRIAPLKNSN